MLHLYCAKYKLDNRNTKWMTRTQNGQVEIITAHPHRKSTIRCTCTYTLLPILLVCSKESVEADGREAIWTQRHTLCRLLEGSELGHLLTVPPSGKQDTHNVIMYTAPGRVSTLKDSILIFLTILRHLCTHRVFRHTQGFMARPCAGGVQAVCMASRKCRGDGRDNFGLFTSVFIFHWPPTASTVVLPTYTIS